MSLRQMFAGSIVKPGFNPLAAPTPTYLYNLFSWGGNNNGQLGLGNRTSYSSPKQVGSLTDWLQIASGDYHTVSVKTDGTLWTWGRNNVGQLGLNNRTYYSSPKQVGSLTTWSSARGANSFTHAITTSGTLWAWGLNNGGQLGLNTNGNYYSSPKQVGSLTTWSKITNGFSGYTLAIRTDGTLWSWGDNSYGNLGVGNINSYSSPTQVGSLTNWSSVSIGYYATGAVKTDGTLWTWGYNTQGQLGQGNLTYLSSPKQVGSLTNWSSVAMCQQYATAAIKTDGTLWTWGYGLSGQLGTGSTTNKSSPVQVGSLTTWLYIAGGNAAFFAVKTDGTLWAWGGNADGNLGLNNRTAYSSPKQIGAVATWKAPSAGYKSVFSLG